MKPQKERAEFTQQVIRIIKGIPLGRVATYGQIAALAGQPRGARQVARILHSCSKSDGLPWHRVVNRQGKISLAPGQGYEKQLWLLTNEGVSVDPASGIDLRCYLWQTEE